MKEDTRVVNLTWATQRPPVVNEELDVSCTNVAYFCDGWSNVELSLAVDIEVSIFLSMGRRNNFEHP